MFVCGLFVGIMLGGFSALMLYSLILNSKEYKV